MKTVDKIIKWVAFLNEVLQSSREKYKVHFPTVEEQPITSDETTIQ